MAVFGHYEAVRELARQGSFTVSMARPAGSADEPVFVIKAFVPFVEIMGEEAAKRGTELFQEAAALQKRLAEAPGSLWAPIHEFGPAEGGAYYVTDHYRRSAQQLVDLRVPLKHPALHRVVESVVNALLQLKRTERRSHGNLSASNVLMAGEGSIAKARVLLTDPAGSPGDEADDLRALGELIHLLVCHRSSKAGIAAGEWAKLGRRGEGWRKLCARLVDVSGTGKVTLEDVAEELKSLGKAKGGPPAAVLAACAIVVLGTVGAGVYLAVRPRETAEVTTKGGVAPPLEKWNSLVVEFKGWFANFLVQTGPKNADRVKRWSADEYLKAEVLDRLQAAKAAKVEFDPRLISRRHGERVSSLAQCEDNPPGGAVADTTNALEVIEAIKAAITAEKWPLLATCAGAETTYEGRGWLQEADYVKSLVDRVKPTAGVADAIDDIVRAGAILTGIEQKWTSLVAAEEVLKNCDDEIIGRFAQFVSDLTRSEKGSGGGLVVLRDLADKVKSLAGLAEDLAADVTNVWPRTDRECFKQHSNSHGKFKESGEVDRSLFVSWHAEVSNPDFRLDPKTNPFFQPWADAVGELQKKLDDLKELERLQKEQEAAAINDKLAQLQQAIKKGREMPCSRCRQANINDRTSSELAKLKQETSAALDETRERLEGRIADLSTPEPVDADPRVKMREQIASIAGKLDRIAPDEAKLPEIKKRFDELKKEIETVREFAWVKAYRETVAAKDRREYFESLLREIEPLVPPDECPALTADLDYIGRTIAALQRDSGGKWSGKTLQAEMKPLAARIAELCPPKTARTVEEVAAEKKALAAMKARIDGLTDAIPALLKKSTAAPSGSVALDEQWARLRDKIVDDATDADAARKSAKSLEEAVAEIDAAFRARPPEGDRPRDWDDKLLAKVFGEKREEAVRKAVALIAAGPDGAWSVDRGKLAEITGAFKNDVETGLADLMGNLAKIEKLLDDGWDLDEDASGVSLAALSEQVAKNRSYAAFQKATAPLIDRLGRLRDLKNAAGKEALAKLAKQVEEPVLAINAWRRLVRLPNWPERVSEMDDELVLEEQIGKLIESRIRDASRRKTLAGELAAEPANLWMKGFRTIAAGKDAAAMDKAIELRGRFRVDDSRLEQWAQYDVRLQAFGRKFSNLRARVDGLPKEQHSAALAEFKGELDGLRALLDGLPAGFAVQPAVKDLLVVIEALSKWKPADRGQAAHAGPGSPSLPEALQWRAMLADDGTSCQFSWPATGDPKHVIEFVRIEPRTVGGKPVYLCTTEMSAGVFVDINEADKWSKPDVIARMQRGVWLGPCGWVWDAGSGRIRLDSGKRWMAPVPGLSEWNEPGAKPYYKDHAKVREPSAGMPMQYIAAGNAGAFAALLGCRLPTEDEWAAAVASDTQDPARLCLRGTAWIEQRDYISSVIREARLRPNYPSESIFWPTGPAVKKEKPETALAVMVDTPGMLWFVDVTSDTGGRLHHMIGNVAEFVSGEPGKFGVVGGSSLSSPMVWNGRDMPFTRKYDCDANRAYSDVGFRLAYESPDVPLPDLLKRFQASMVYVGPQAANSP